MKMNLVSKTRLVSAVAVFAALAGCMSAADTSIENPNFFGVKTGDGKLTGSYNPAGFTSSQVKKHIKVLCKGNTLGSYGEEVSENGLATFSATCASGTKLSVGFTEIETDAHGKTSNQSVGS